MRKGDVDRFAEALALEEAQSEPIPEPRHKPRKPRVKGWWPNQCQTKSGRKIFNTITKYNLAHGERGSGKTMDVLGRLVRHCYENDNALAVVVTLTRSSATLGGAWEKLLSIILPEWVEGIGLEGDGNQGRIQERRDDSQNRYVWIGNKHGGWSRIVMRSMLHGEQIQGRIKGMEFSFFFFDELTETDSEEYFIQPLQQLRRQVNELQFWGACNPSDDGEDHWVYKRWFVKKNQADPKQYATIHVPMHENIFMANRDEYIEQVKEACKSDPTAYDRLIRGLWVKRPRGKGLLAPYFSRATHVLGRRKARVGILPSTRWPIIQMGYDLGPANSCITFEQNPPTNDIPLWSIFDEIIHIQAVDGKNTPWHIIAIEMLKKMNFWCKVMGKNFVFQHLSDSDAFTKKNTDGSISGRQLERTLRRMLDERADSYPHLKHLGKRFKIQGVPKPQGSVAGRVNIVIAKLMNNELKFSDLCPFHIEMVERLEQAPNKDSLHPLKTVRGHIHVFDSMSYPMYHAEMGGRLLNSPEVGEITSDYLEMG